MSENYPALPHFTFLGTCDKAVIQKMSNGFLFLSLGNVSLRCCRNDCDPPKYFEAVKFQVKRKGGGRNDKSFLLKFSPQMDLAEPSSADLKARFIICAGCCLKGEQIFEVPE